MEEETAFSLTLKSINSVVPEQREEFLTNLCHQIDNEDLKISLPPNENSIALDNSNLDIKTSLEKVQAPRQFLETTETIEIEEISKQIECITGFDVVKGIAKELSEIKINSSELKNSHILLQKEVDNLKAALQNDIAEKLGIAPQDVYIRRIVPGSMEILFSVPENVKKLDLNADDLPSFNQILQQNGISKKYKYKQRKVLPDPEKARKILENYTRPVIINTDKNGSQLMDKFQKYIPVLAALSTNVRIVHNEEKHSLEIHGPPSEKAKVLAYFAEIEDALQGAIMANIVIIPEQRLLAVSDYYSRLWNFLYDDAKKFTLKENVNYKNRMQPHSLRQNPNLSRGCPAAQSFIAALAKLNLNPDNPEKVIDHGTFGWHGTRTAQAVISIAENNLDPSPSRRRGQACGVGEYFAKDPVYSQGRYWGDTNTLFLFFILNNHPYYLFNHHYVINNPSQQEMYVVPILIATFNNQVPLKIEPDKIIRYQIKWEWKDDSGWIPYGTGQQTSKSSIQNAIEEMYQKYQTGISISVFTLTFIRLNNHKTDVYKIDFSLMKQTNMRTNYERKIQRVVNPEQESDDQLKEIEKSAKKSSESDSESLE